jgi:hypothetical protein
MKTRAGLLVIALLIAHVIPVSVSVSVLVSTTPIPTLGRESRDKMSAASWLVLNALVSLGKHETFPEQAGVAQLVE